MDFSNKVILITGASYGIGREIAYYFANLKCNIIITYNKSSDLSKKVAEDIINKYNVNIDSIKCNLKEENDIKSLYDFIKNKYNKIDILVNNAALSMDSHLFDKTKEEFMDVLEVNVVGTFLMMKYFHLISDYIFNISSTDAFDTGSSYNIDYSCSKASINCLTNYFSLYDERTKYISLCPNWVDTKPIREMNQDFLKEELKRIKQDKLINPKTIPIMIKKCIVENKKSGSIIRIDGDINE